MSSVLLELRGVSAFYGPARALHDVSIQIDRGQIVSVIGPNGAGKSTLLNAIMGILPEGATSLGSIDLDGVAVGELSATERVLSGISLVPERRELFAEMSVFDNLLLGAVPLRHKKQKSFDDELARVFKIFPRLQERTSQLASTLSGGERQMLALGRALMCKPAVLMLDEPSLGLAPIVVRDIFQVISSLRSSGTAVLLVEQNARAALEISDSGYVLEMGSISLAGPAVELAHDERVVQAYLGVGKRA